MRWMTSRVVVAVLAFSAVLLAGSPAAARSGSWETVVELPWGDGPGELGRTPERDEELTWGPHGIAACPGGAVVIVDRVHGRAVVVGVDGGVARAVDLPGRPGPALCLADGAVVVADERDERRVTLVDGARTTPLASPRWAMPPSRLVAHGPGEEILVEGLDAMQNRLPLSPLVDVSAPGELPAGVPSPDGSWAATVILRQGVGHVVLGDRDVVLPDGVWPVLDDISWRPASLAVLATTPRAAVVALESVSDEPGPLRVGRAVVLVGLGGAVGTPVEVPAPGPIAIPADLAATAEGLVLALVSGADGCRLLRYRLDEAEVAP